MAPKLAYFVLFGRDQEAAARAFVADLPADCRAEVNAPGDPEDELEPEHWYVVVRGRWRGYEEAEPVLRALAARHGGEYDGVERDLPS